MKLKKPVMKKFELILSIVLLTAGFWFLGSVWLQPNVSMDYDNSDIGVDVNVSPVGSKMAISQKDGVVEVSATFTTNLPVKSVHIERSKSFSYLPPFSKYSNDLNLVLDMGVATEQDSNKSLLNNFKGSIKGLEKGNYTINILNSDATVLSEAFSKE